MPIEEVFSQGTDGLLTDKSVIYLKTNSKQIEKAVDSLILAKAWLGKILGELGESTPYANDGNRKTVEDIEPAADTHKQINETHTFGKEQGIISEDYLDFTHIEKVDWLREEIDSLLPIVKGLQADSNYTYLFWFVIQHLSEARFRLGFELQRIRETSTSNI